MYICSPPHLSSQNQLKIIQFCPISFYQFCRVLDYKHSVLGLPRVIIDCAVAFMPCNSHYRRCQVAAAVEWTFVRIIQSCRRLQDYLLALTPPMHACAAACVKQPSPTDPYFSYETRIYLRLIFCLFMFPFYLHNAGKSDLARSKSIRLYFIFSYFYFPWPCSTLSLLCVYWLLLFSFTH